MLPVVEFGDFKEKVAETWQNAGCVGDPMFVLWEKLKLLKPTLRGGCTVETRVA